MGTQPLEVFYSYASLEGSVDEHLQQQLEKHLGVLQRQGKIAHWHKRNILAGQIAQQETENHLKSAQIILLLISPDFIASDECWNVEMERALERQQEEKALVIPVLLRPVDYKEAPFTHLRVLPKNGKPVTSWGNQDEAFEDIARNIRLLAEKYEQTQRISWKDVGAGITLMAALSLLVASDGLIQQALRPRTYTGSLVFPERIFTSEESLVLRLSIDNTSIRGYCDQIGQAGGTQSFPVQSAIGINRTVSFEIHSSMFDVYHFSGNIASNNAFLQGEGYKRSALFGDEPFRWKVSMSQGGGTGGGL